LYFFYLPDFIEEDLVTDGRLISSLCPVQLIVVTELEELLSHNSFLLDRIRDVLVNPVKYNHVEIIITYDHQMYRLKRSFLWIGVERGKWYCKIYKINRGLLTAKNQLILIYSARRLIRSRLIESAAYSNQILMALLYFNNT